MKKVLILILVLTTLLVTGCGEKEESSDKSNNNGSKTNTSTPSETTNGKIDLSDNKNFFIIVDGVRFDTNTKIKDILDKGYTLGSSDEKSLTKEFEAGKGQLSALYMKRDGNTIFGASPVNRSNKTITKSECTIYEIFLYDTWYTNVTIVGGLTMGSTIEEVEAVFGTDTLTRTTRSEREKTLGEGFGGKNDVSMGYKKPGPGTDGKFEFSFNDDGKLAYVRMQSNK